MALRLALPLAAGVTLLLRAGPSRPDRLSAEPLVASAKAAKFKVQTYEDGPAGAWTILPWLLAQKTVDDWYVVAEPHTRLRAYMLTKELKLHPESESKWLGFPLIDQDSFIVHHYDSTRIRYPCLAAGMAISGGMVSALQRAAAGTDVAKISNFHIDPAFDLARAVQSLINASLTPSLGFCVKDRDRECGMYIGERSAPPLPVDLQKDVVFGVKTTAKFHDDRVVATRRTWAQDFDVTFYSDLEKGTDIVDVGVNTEKGHCAKLFAILQRLPDRGSFVALGDDDTFWNTTRLQQVLTWYDPAEPMAIGERYGYSRYANRGYDYLTSGSGMVFTQTALSRFRKCAEDGHCSCPQADTYDDMMLGRWLNSADVPAVHEVGFHQRRPFDYHPTYLQLEGPAVSFHSVFGQRTDPDRLYAEYLAPAGSKVPSPKNAEL